MSVPNAMTRRDAAELAAAIAAPWIQQVKAGNNQVQMAIIGTGVRGRNHITHLNGLDGGAWWQPATSFSQTSIRR